MWVMERSVDQATGTRLRKDAAENRARLLDAARRVFATHGTDVPLETIAAEAGVGIATLYRRFPTREDLLAAIIREELDDYLEALEETLSRDDAWEGFSLFLEQMFQLQIRHPGLCHAPFAQLPDVQSIDEGRARMMRLTEELIDRAKQDGTLRPDVTAEDVMLAGWGNTGIIANATKASPDAFRRYLGFILDAFRVQEPRSGAPLTTSAERAKRRQGRSATTKSRRTKPTQDDS